VVGVVLAGLESVCLAYEATMLVYFFKKNKRMSHFKIFKRTEA
jgi:hypothetical protein